MWAQARSSILAAGVMAAIVWASAMSAGGAPGEQVSVADATIAAVNGSSLTIATGGGERVVKVESGTLILERATTTLATIRPGDALGVAAKRGPDGSLTAISINIFSPELWSRARQGQFPMESGDVMTNAVVMQYADRVDGRTLYMKYNDGATTIIVPATTVIHRLTTVRLRDLKPGMRITVRGLRDSDGTIRASSITFDRPGQG